MLRQPAADRNSNPDDQARLASVPMADVIRVGRARRSLLVAVAVPFIAPYRGRCVRGGQFVCGAGLGDSNGNHTGAIPCVAGLAGCAIRAVMQLLLGADWLCVFHWAWLPVAAGIKNMRLPFSGYNHYT